MSSEPTEDPYIAVLGDADQLAAVDDRLWSGEAFMEPHAGPPTAEVLEEMLDARARLFVVVGDDGYLGRVLTLYHRHLRGHTTPFRLCVVDAGADSVVADTLDAPKLSKRNVAALARKARVDDLDRTSLSTLRVTSSAREAADLGFSFGAGLLFELFEASRRASSSGLSGIASELGRLGRRTLFDGEAGSMEGARLAVNRRPARAAPAYLLAGSLDRSWFGLKLRDDAPRSYRAGDSTSSLVGQVARNRAVPRLLDSGSDAEPFETIHIDWSHGYVLDGQLFEPARPYVVQVAEGPPAHFFSI